MPELWESLIESLDEPLTELAARLPVADWRVKSAKTGRVEFIRGDGRAEIIWSNDKRAIGRWYVHGCNVHIGNGATLVEAIESAAARNFDL